VTLAPSPNEENNYMQAREGDSLFCPFECDECLFHRITGVPSIRSNDNHQRLLDHIRRANLDAFWSRAKDTVRELRRMFFEEIKLGEHFGFDMFPKPMGPFPPDYDGGIRAAIGILSRSNRPGRHEEKQKFSSSRKARSVHANVFMASALGGATSKSVRSDKGHQALTSAPTDT
jgi:hypothetical protein